jgi:predicted DNA binding CopG/RHH family protein
MKKEYDLRKLKPRTERVKVNRDAAKVAISLRIDGSVLAALKTEAEQLGLHYQTYIGSILHQYAEGYLIDRKTIGILKKLKAS